MTKKPRLTIEQFLKPKPMELTLLPAGELSMTEIERIEAMADDRFNAAVMRLIEKGQDQDALNLLTRAGHDDPRHLMDQLRFMVRKVDEAEASFDHSAVKLFWDSLPPVGPEAVRAREEAMGDAEEAIYQARMQVKAAKSEEEMMARVRRNGTWEDLL